ncbi:MAG: hypothetical protein LBR10_05185 [Prevotellaceae bacterium]|jgi:hypothetical protein|nr:hypothetical protein [Prevotellaceae bacterium]
MQEKIKSEGKCPFCGKTFAKAGINRHLITHLKEKEASGKPGKSFLVKVETNKRWGYSPYFLSLWIDCGASMKDLDTFLRKIWLECCGHMSAFRKREKRSGRDEIFDMMDEYLGRGNIVKYEKMMEEIDDTVPMSRKVKDILYKDLILEYEYDFGSSTELSITVMGEYSVKADKKIVLLSRNEPLDIMCNSCKKVPATQICTACIYEKEAEFCDKCAKKHAKKCEDFEDYASLPVVNSPRMGVCGYTGGTIDMERDRVSV